ncbi:serine/threonine protein kinase [Coraliomargarita akajimensis]|uniref:Serine/threonine protein kinase n=1 Tax=Coraliomargarita akajimensis (strain DSM 45221 / IAM 15411 / JCM 23193 / KCTC 12865 / 04OKA010-24) TaxID=583355 RepID=D5EIF1_CORAD|nr:serine/threonine-protein kinase [Coraliomargarita akajimensis]ADE54217.1 serine/threonine protein kinase [Coraliomargarita akajimensis DSM 45221]
MPPLKHIFQEIRLQVVRTIAAGGMGVVYEAEQHGSGQFSKRIAVKLIREEYSKIDEFRNNFIGEAKLVADLIHTNIVQTYHLGEISGQYYMTMEYVDGITVEDFIERHKATQQQIPADIASFIVSRVCRGLAYAHQKSDAQGRPLGIVHRDVNPRNIMLAKEGDVKLTDFGIAKALDLMYNEEGEVIAGKDEYLSPEQARREITDARADLFGCAIVLSELLLCDNIFEATTPEATRRNILELPIPDFYELRPEIDPRLDDILQHAFRRDREKRYQSAHHMLTALEKFIYGDGYGPTNEKLASYVEDLYSADGTNAAARWKAGETPGLDDDEV